MLLPPFSIFYFISDLSVRHCLPKTNALVFLILSRKNLRSLPETQVLKVTRLLSEDNAPKNNDFLLKRSVTNQWGKMRGCECSRPSWSPETGHQGWSDQSEEAVIRHTATERREGQREGCVLGYHLDAGSHCHWQIKMDSWNLHLITARCGSLRGVHSRQMGTDVGWFWGYMLPFLWLEQQDG